MFVSRQKKQNTGATLLEVIIFLVIIGVAIAATMNIFTQNLLSNTDPLIRVRALELAQAQLDEILARKFDENTPTGGVPACNSSSGAACLGIVADSDFDDVGDFHNFSDSSISGYQIAVSVTEAGTQLGLSNDQARLVTVSVTTPPMAGLPSGDSVTLSAYKVNF